MKQIRANAKKIMAKKGLIAQTYTILIGLLALMYFVVTQVRKNPKLASKFCGLMASILVTVVALLLLIAMYVFRKVLGPIGQLFVVAFIVVAMALTLQCMTGRYDMRAVNRFFIITVLVFIVTSLLGMLTILLGWNLGPMGMVLFAGLVTVIVIGVVFLFVPPSKTIYKVYHAIGVFLFSLYVVYDTNLLVLEETNASEAALGFFLEFINIFARLLSFSPN